MSAGQSQTPSFLISAPALKQKVHLCQRGSEITSNSFMQTLNIQYNNKTTPSTEIGKIVSSTNTADLFLKRFCFLMKLWMDSCYRGFTAWSCFCTFCKQLFRYFLEQNISNHGTNYQFMSGSLENKKKKHAGIQKESRKFTRFPFLLDQISSVFQWLFFRLIF